MKKFDVASIANAKWIGWVVAIVAGIGAFSSAVQEQKQADKIEELEGRVSALENE